MKRFFMVLVTGMGLVIGSTVAFSAQGNECVEFCRGRGLTGLAFGDCVAACARGDAIPCGDTVCDASTDVCCNESCSICAPCEGCCIQIFCETIE